VAGKLTNVRKNASKVNFAKWLAVFFLLQLSCANVPKASM